MMEVPFVDLKAQYRSIKAEIDSAMEAVFESGQFVGGRIVHQFETSFAGWLGANHCIGVGNGTDALYLALRALNIGPGDEVITVAHTFIATAEAVSHVGARPVFVDVRRDTGNIDPALLSAAI